MKKNKLKERLYTVFFMFSVTFVFISVLSVAYTATRGRIAINESLDMKKAILQAAGLPLTGSPEEIEAEFKDSIIESVSADNSFYYEAVRPGEKEPWAYIFMNTGAGLWGEIMAVVGLKPDMKTLTGISFLKQNETPGLGARIEEKWFREQFVGKTGPFDKMVGEKETPGPGQFSAITGATITSGAVKNIINFTIQKAGGDENHIQGDTR